MNRFQFSGGSNLTTVVKNLLIINVLFFVATFILEQKGVYLNQLLGVYYFDSPNFRYWQVLSYMFMHGGIGHIFFNMFALYMFGPILENIWGSQRFLYFYLITAIGAVALQMGAQAIEMHMLTGDFTRHALEATQVIQDKVDTIYYSPVIGASGAIFGLLLAFGMLFPNAELYIFFIPVAVKAKYMVPVYIVLELFLGVAQFSGDSVAHFAHLGGALFGYIIIKIWNRGQSPRLQ